MNKDLKLLLESTATNVEEGTYDLVAESIFIIKERELEEGKGKTLVASGMLLDTSKPTLNKRLYSTATTRRAVSEYKRDYVKKGSGFMLDGHPDFFYGGAKPSSIVARLTNVWMEDKLVMGDFTIVETGAGKDVKAVVDVGGRLGVSLRGTASVSDPDPKTGVMKVLDDFKLLGFDIVLNPASSEAGIDKYHYEQKIEGGDDMNLAELIAKYPDLMKEHGAGVTAKCKETHDAEVVKMKEDIATEISDEMKEAQAEKMEDIDYDNPVVVAEDNTVECPACESSIPVACNSKEGQEETEEMKTLTKELTATKKKLGESEKREETSNKRLDTLEESNTKLAVEKHVAEQLKLKIENETVREAIAEKIGIPDSVEEADKVIEKEVKFLSTMKESGTVNLEGGIKPPVKDKVTEAEQKRDMTLAGIDEIDED